MICKNCGQALVDGAAFCMSCGTKVNNDAVQSNDTLVMEQANFSQPQPMVENVVSAQPMPEVPFSGGAMSMGGVQASESVEKQPFVVDTNQASNMAQPQGGFVVNTNNAPTNNPYANNMGNQGNQQPYGNQGQPQNPYTFQANTNQTNQVEDKKDKKTIIIIVAVVAVALLLCCCCLPLGASFLMSA